MDVQRENVEFMFMFIRVGTNESQKKKTLIHHGDLENTRSELIKKKKKSCSIGESHVM